MFARRRARTPLRRGTLTRSLAGGCAAVVALVVTASPSAAVVPARGAASSGCAHPGPAGVTTQSIAVGSTVRTYRLAVPSGPGPFGLVLNFHGVRSNDVEQAAYSQLEEAGPAAGDVVVTPQGTAPTSYWNILPGLATPDDVGYAGQLIDHTERTECIDPPRVDSTGISNGAGLSALLGCKITSRLAAIAPVAGVNLVASCPRGTPLSVLAFHGTSDPVVPYTGGQLSPALASLSTSPVPQAVAAWAQRDRCAARPTQTQLSAQVTTTTYRRCAAGTAVMLYSIVGGGHTWPGSPFVVPSLGLVTRQISATDLMLAFFRHHTRPGATAAP